MKYISEQLILFKAIEIENLSIMLSKQKCCKRKQVLSVGMLLIFCYLCYQGVFWVILYIRYQLIIFKDNLNSKNKI